MKARIKKTGEIVNLASYATITLDQHDSWGNPIEMKPEEVELLNEETAKSELYKQWGYESLLQDYWMEVRERAAIAAMQGLLVNRIGSAKQYAEVAVEFADALIKQLRKEEE